MRRARHILGKEILQNRRDPLATLFTIFLPVIFTVVLGLVIGGAESSRLPLALADGDDSTVSQDLIARLQDSPVLELREMTAEDAEDAVHDQEVAAALIIPKGFGAAVQAGDATELVFVGIETSTGAQSASEAIRGTVARLNASILASQVAAQQVATRATITVDENLLGESRALVDAQALDPALSVELRTSGATADSHAQGFDQTSPGMIVNFVLFGLMGVAGMTVLERRQGLLRRLSIAGARARDVIGGKLLAMFILTFLEQVLLVLVGQLVLGVDYFNSPLALLATMVSLSLLASAFGLLISTVLRSENAVIAAIVISAQLLAALGGAWFPLEVTGETFSQVAHYLPTAWIMDSFHGIILQSWSIADVLMPLGIVWAWIVGLLGLAVWRYRPD